MIHVLAAYSIPGQVPQAIPMSNGSMMNYQQPQQHLGRRSLLLQMLLVGKGDNSNFPVHQLKNPFSPPLPSLMSPCHSLSLLPSFFLRTSFLLPASLPSPASLPPPASLYLCVSHHHNLIVTADLAGPCMFVKFLI